MKTIEKSYIICCTPRSGSHFFAGCLASTGIAGKPRERFPRPTCANPQTREEREWYITKPPPESSYDPVEDTKYVREIIEYDLGSNGVFGVTIHWFQLEDAIRRIRPYVDANLPMKSGAEVLLRGLPNLSYIWLRRRDKVAQAVSWYKAIETGRYTRLRDTPTNFNPEQEIEFNFKKIKSHLSALKSFDNGWRSFFASNGITPLAIFYEDLVENRKKVVSKVLKHLCLSMSEFELDEPRHQKSADAQSKEWGERFRALESESNFWGYLRADT
jgi:LPS sulfotransferase NodH